MDRQMQDLGNGGSAYLAAVLVSTNSRTPLLWYWIAGSCLKESSPSPPLRPYTTKTSKSAR